MESELAERIQKQELQTAQLEQFNERMADILNSTSDAFIICGPGGTIQQANNIFGKQFGYEPDETPGWKLSQLIEEADRSTFTEVMDITVKTQSHYRGEVRFQFAWIEDHSIPFLALDAKL